MLDRHSRKRYYYLMEIRVLKYFLAVAREGNITKAANFLHLTQPTLSRQLQDLEKELGQKLLIRGRHNVALTPEGHILRQRAEEIINLTEKTVQEFHSIKDTISGTVYIGSGESYAIKNITDIMKEIQDQYSEIKFDLLSGNSDDITEKLEKGLLDFAVLIEPIDISKYNYLTLPDKDRWGVIMKKNSPMAKYKNITYEDLEKLPLIFSKKIKRQNPSDSDFMKWFKGSFDNFNIVATYNLIYNAGLMAESGIGYVVGLDKLINTTNNTNLTFRPLYPSLESKLNIVWKKSQIFSPAAKLFLEKLQEKY